MAKALYEQTAKERCYVNTTKQGAIEMQVGDVNYEILVRRQGETVYSAFCPQLELIVRGTAHEQVENRMKELILEHVAKQQQSAADKKPE